MTEKETIELYARIFNTIQEMARTLDNENLSNETILLLAKTLENIDELIHESENFTKEQKEQYNILTDNMHDRIYFNCYKPWENERQ